MQTFYLIGNLPYYYCVFQRFSIVSPLKWTEDSPKSKSSTKWFLKLLVADHSSVSVFLLSSTAKVPRPSESQNTKTALGGGESDFSCKWTGCHNTTDTLEPLSLSNTAVQRPVPISHVSGPSGAMYTDQDQPLSFDNTRLAVATAAFRGPLAQRGSSQMQNLAAVLQSSLPNLSDSSLKQTFSAQSKDRDAKVEAEERIPGKPSSTAVTEERTGHILGLDCYSSSDEECDSWLSLSPFKLKLVLWITLCLKALTENFFQNFSRMETTLTTLSLQLQYVKWNLF